MKEKEELIVKRAQDDIKMKELVQTILDIQIETNKNNITS